MTRTEVNTGGPFVDLNVIPEIVATEGFQVIIENTDINNDLIEEEADFIPENSEEREFTSYEKAPTLEFSNIEGVDEAIVSSWVPWKQDQRRNEEEEFYVGQRFPTKSSLQSEVKLYSMRTHHQYIVINSNKSLLVLKCMKSEQCKWKLRASKIKGENAYQIKKYIGPHTCVYPMINRDHQQLDFGFVADQIQSIVKEQLSIKIAAIQSFIQNQFNYCISYKKAWNAKQKAIEKLFGGWEESFDLMPKYMAELQEQNPRTIVVCQKDLGPTPGTNIFKRIFWAFGPSIQGFKNCRPLISIDGTHLYGKYRGTLLIAVSTDGNNQLFPLAFAIVEGENMESWAWFLECIRRYATSSREGLCVISDRHAGILGTMNSDSSGWKEPNAYHRICMRHLASNFNKHFHNKTLKSLLCKAAKAHQVWKFDRVMEEIKRHNHAAWEWLDVIPKEKWALAHDGGHRYGVMTTNLSEIFNSVLKGARNLPITALIQLTFYRVNSYFSIRREWAEKRAATGQPFTPSIDSKLNGYLVKANAHDVILFDHVKGVFSVKTGHVRGNRHKGGNTHIIDLQKLTCTCQKFQLYGFPCSHVIAGCQSRSLDILPLVQSWYTIHMYSKTWEPRFNPIRDKHYWSPWEGTSLLPNDCMRRNKKGRPKSTRLHNEMDVREGRAPITCGNCKKEGHNRRTCPNTD